MFEQAKEDSFAAGSAALFTAHPARAEVALFELDRPVEFGRHGAPSHEPVAQKQEAFIDSAPAQAHEPDRIRGRQIHHKQA